MKRLITLFVLSSLSYGLLAQSKPNIGTISKNQVNINSGSGFVIVSGLNDGDANVNQNLTVTAQSSNTSVLDISAVDYIVGNSYAVIKINEKGLAGTSNITVQVSDADGNSSKDFNIEVGQFLKKGINWSVFDMIFWQQVIPLNEKSLFDSVLTQISVPTDENIFNKLPLTVGPTNNLPKHDFFTSMFKGYIVPPSTGTYTFSLSASDQSTLWLSTDANYSNAKELIKGNTGTMTASLQAGKFYAIYAVNWAVHDLNMKIEWEGPGVTKSIVNSNFLYPNYDLEKPSTPLLPLLQFKGITSARLIWNKSKDNQVLKGYHIYLNGVKVGTTTDTTFTLSPLTSSTRYSAFITSFDVTGNESFPTQNIEFTTYAPDNVKPTAPTKISTLTIGDVSTSISWSGAKDVETEIAGYKVYLNGELFNTKNLISDTTTVLKVLQPLTSYNVQIEAVDAGNNVSNKSNSIAFKTIKFDPLKPSPNTKKARANFTKQAITRNEGLGISGGTDNLKNISPQIKQLLDDLKPSVQRWGTLGPNKFSFIDYSGAGKPQTYASFMQRCNIMNSYTAIVIGVQNDTDWMKDSTTFTKFIEYLNGPATSVQGKRRADEGIAEPLFAKSRGLIIDLGTEVWGGAGLHGAEIGADYAVYAKWCRRMAKIIKASPYYDSTKVVITYSGRNPSPAESYGLNAALTTGDKGEVDWMSVSGYLGGNLNYDPAIPLGASELDYYKNGIERMNNNFLGSRLHLREDFRNAKRYLTKNFYESNMTTPNYSGRLGQAIIMTDYMLSIQRWGITLPSIFDLTGGEWRITEPAENYKKFPLFHTAALVNRFTIGNMLNSEVVSPDKIFSTTGKPIEMEPIGFNVFSQNGKYSIVLTSRDFENDYQVQLNLPDGILNGSTARKYFLTGTDFNTKDAIIDSANITITDSMLITVPKYSMVLLTFNGTDLKQKPLPLGYTTFGRIGKLTILPENGTKGSVSTPTLTFGVKLEPAILNYKNVIWTVDKNPNLQVTPTLLSSGKYTLKGSGACDGNGTLMLKVMSADDNTILDELQIEFVGQKPDGSDCPVGVEDAELQQFISVFPNPVKDNLNIQSKLGEISHIKVFNMVGQILYDAKLNASSTELSMETFAKGIYLIQIDTNGKSIRKTIIKN